MTVEVFQWRIDPDRASAGAQQSEMALTDPGAPEVVSGQASDRLVGEAWALLLMGSVDKLREIMNNPNPWSERGLTLLKAAEVDTDDLSEAFKLTNNIDSSWTDNEGVKPFLPVNQCRSTSVGDLMRLAIPNGTVHMVGMMGFVDIPELKDTPALPAHGRMLPSPGGRF